MAKETIAAFRKGVEAGDSEAVLATIADDIVFNNPVTFRPFHGRETVAMVVPKLLEVWQDLRYIAELDDEDGLVALVFDARVGTRDVRGIDLLGFSEDRLISKVTVMVRPLSGLHALAKEMKAALAA